MRRIDHHGLLPALALMTVMLITVEHRGDFSTDSNKQLSLSTTMTIQHKEQENTSYTSNVTNALGSYYDNTVTILTDDYNIRVDPTAMGEAVVHGIEGGVRSASKGSLFGVYAGDFIEGVVLRSIGASGLGLAIRMKNACDSLQADTAGCEAG